MGLGTRLLLYFDKLNLSLHVSDKLLKIFFMGNPVNNIMMRQVLCRQVLDASFGERLTSTQKVLGSNPSWSQNFFCGSFSLSKACNIMM